MPRFYFDVFDGDNLTADKTGLDVEDGLDRVRYLAIDALPDIARERLPDGNRREFFIRVRDDGGTEIFRASLTFVAEWVGGPHA